MAPGSPAVFRYAAGASEVADIARKGSTPALSGQETHHEAVAGVPVDRAEALGDERGPGRLVDRRVEDRVGDAGRVGRARADHLRAVVEVQPGIVLVRLEVRRE